MQLYCPLIYLDFTSLYCLLFCSVGFYVHGRVYFCHEFSIFDTSAYIPIFLLKFKNYTHTLRQLIRKQAD